MGKLSFLLGGLVAGMMIGGGVGAMYGGRHDEAALRQLRLSDCKNGVLSGCTTALSVADPKEVDHTYRDLANRAAQ